ncbi:MAG: hypothetical protein AB7P76_05400 [Candidatus Melainabacteria bacterium]
MNSISYNVSPRFAATNRSSDQVTTTINGQQVTCTRAMKDVLDRAERISPGIAEAAFQDGIRDGLIKPRH